jgi:hypothetical protein
MSDTPCPSRAELLAYQVGELSEDPAKGVTSHVSSCPSCQVTLRALAASEDTLLAHLRAPVAEDPYVAEPECQRFLARAMEMVVGTVAVDAPAPAAPEPLGRLGEYELLAKLGEGGMGAVYQARHTRLKRLVALKVLPKAKTSDPNAVARFELTSAGQTMGTADYMAPEQASDSHAVDIRADIYSLGCTLYKLLTGHAPFSDRQHETPLKKLMAHIQEPVPPIRQRRPDVPEALAEVLDRMLGKSPADRYATPAEVADALASPLPSAGEGLGVRAVDAADLARLAAEAAAIADGIAPTQPAKIATDPHLSSAMTGTQAGN